MAGDVDMGDIDGVDVLDPEGDRIGAVGAVYFDTETEEPVWVAIATATPDAGEALVPLEGAVFDRGALHLTFARWIVDQSPRGAGAELTVDDQNRLFQYYDIDDWPTSGGRAVRGRAGLAAVEARRRERDDAELGGAGVGEGVNTQEGN